MTDAQRTAQRLRHLAAWFADEDHSWLDAHWERVQADTAETYGAEELEKPQRFAIVQRLELPGRGDVIVQTFDDAGTVEQELAQLLNACGDTSWFPWYVIDTDTGETRAFETRCVLMPPVAVARG